MLQSRNHPALARSSGLMSSPLEAEFEAAHASGLIPDLQFEVTPERNWFELSRLTRAQIVVRFKLKNLSDVLLQWDANRRGKSNGG